MKRTSFIAIALAFLIAVAFVSCDGDNATPPQKECEHEWGSSVVKVPSTCTTEGEAEYICAKCGEKKNENIPMNNYHNYVDYKCKDCSAWGKGPAGGYVFYDCDADNDKGNRDGLISTECGWRFLEAAPADLRVIKGIPTVDSNVEGYDKATREFLFGFYRTTPEGENQTIDAKEKIGTGKENTKKFYEAMGEENGYRLATGDSEPFTEYPARLCSILEYTGADGNTYDDWFLPSLNEMEQMYNDLIKNGLASFEGEKYFHSSVLGSGRDTLLLWASGSNGWYNMSCNRELTEAFIRPIRSF